MKHVLFILVLLLFCCSNTLRNTTDKATYNRNFRVNSDLQTQKTEFVVIDTVSLTMFWNKLKNDLRTGNNTEVIEVFNYPIHAYYLVLFKFAYDCDTTSFNVDEDKYGNFDIDKNNIEDYYDFVFTDYLKDMIYQTRVTDVVEKGYRYKNNAGLTYNFFPQHCYKYARNNCPNDHLLKFHISFANNKWNIEIGGL
jgi:hypothetical protein